MLEKLLTHQKFSTVINKSAFELFDLLLSSRKHTQRERHNHKKLLNSGAAEGASRNLHLYYHMNQHLSTI